jgi:hypothetical protein
VSAALRLSISVLGAVLLSVTLAACGPSRSEANRQTPSTAVLRTEDDDVLCEVLSVALPTMRRDHRRVVDLLEPHGRAAEGEAAMLAFSRFMVDAGARLGRFDAALRYLVGAFEQEGRQPGRHPSAEVLASAKAIDREIARGRCR